MFHFLRRFLDCWTLARRIQRGELIAVPPTSLPAQLREARPAITPPEAVVEEEVDPAKQWHIRLNRDGTVKVIATHADARIALREWQLYRPTREGAKIELYDVALGIVRGTRG